MWDSPQWAWIAGRWFRLKGRTREAEVWYRRAARLARWKEDWEWMALSLNSLGNVYYECGNYVRAERTLQRALRVARRHAVKDHEGEILHDLFILTFVGGKQRQAEVYARQALERYLPSHDRLAAFAYDVAYFWIAQGKFEPALQVLERVGPHLPAPGQQLQIAASVGRAAGAIADQSRFASAWEQCWSLVADAGASAGRAAAFVDLAMGAASLADRQRADAAARYALQLATERGESDVMQRAGDLLKAIASDGGAVTQERHRSPVQAELLMGMVVALSN